MKSDSVNNSGINSGYAQRSVAFRLALASMLLCLAVTIVVSAQDDFARLKAQGISYYQRNDLTRARDFFIRAARIRQDAEVYQYLSEIYRRLGDTEYAERLAERARQLKQGDTATGEVKAAEPGDHSPPLIEITSPQLTRGLQVVKSSGSRIRIAGRALDPSGISEVTVAGVAATVDIQGNFIADVALQNGENHLVISAVDKAGNRAEKEITINSEAGGRNSVENSPAAAAISLTSPGRYIALVIGNNAYRNNGVPPLLTAVSDAQEVSRVLQDDYGFEVQLLLNASRRQIMSAMSEYRKNLDGKSNLLIYYAGHGFYDKPADKGYWLPIDAEADNQANWISADDLTTSLRTIKARHILIVADSCYSGTLTRDISAHLNIPAERQRMLQRMLEGVSRTIIASGGNEPVADSGGGKHSVFAAALLKGLNTFQDDAFTADELFFQHIRQQVSGRANQQPQYDTIRNSGHEEGDFVFLRKR